METDRSYLDICMCPDLVLFEECINECRGRLIPRPKIIVSGKEGTQRRNIGFFAGSTISSYKYSGYMAESQPLTPSLIRLLGLINGIYKSEYNGILINQYIDGCDTLGAHSDNERELDPVGVVAISWGVTRPFRVRNKRTTKIITDVEFASGEMMIMGGDFQKEFTHEIPVRKRIQGERISFTFRKHI